MIKAQWFKNFTLHEAVEMIKAELVAQNVLHVICYVDDPLPSPIVESAIMQDETWWHFAEDIADWFDLVYLQKQVNEVWYLVFLRKLKDVQDE